MLEHVLLYFPSVQSVQRFSASGEKDADILVFFGKSGSSLLCLVRFSRKQRFPKMDKNGLLVFDCRNVILNLVP